MRSIIMAAIEISESLWPTEETFCFCSKASIDDGH